MPLAPMRRRPSRSPLPSLPLPFALLLIAVLAGGCVATGTKPSPMVCPSTPPGCAKEDVPWYQQDVTAMIPPPPAEPRRPPEEIAAATTTDDTTAAPVDPPLPAEAEAPAPGPVVSTFAVTRDKEPASEPAAPVDAPRASEASARAESPPPALPPATRSAPATGGTEQGTQLVQLPSDELFNLGSAILGTGGRRSLDALADRLHGTGYTRIHVIAHTDRTGQPMTNLKLSWQRARNVRDHLATRGIPGDVLDHEGRGSLDASIDPDRCGRQKAARIRCLAPDRRVDIVVTQRKAP